MREMKEREERGRERERRKEEERKNRERERAVVALHPSLVLGRSGASELRMHPTSALLNEHTRQAKNVKAAPAHELEPKWVRMMMSMLLLLLLLLPERGERQGERERERDVAMSWQCRGHSIRIVYAVLLCL